MIQIIPAIDIIDGKCVRLVQGDYSQKTTYTPTPLDMAKMFAGDSWLGTSGPDNVGLTTVLYIYNTFHDYGELPRASVMSWVLFIIIFGISMINFKLKKKWVDE